MKKETKYILYILLVWLMAIILKMITNSVELFKSDYRKEYGFAPSGIKTYVESY